MDAMHLCQSDSTSFDEKIIHLMNINSDLFCLKPESNYSEPNVCKRHNLLFSGTVWRPFETSTRHQPTIFNDTFGRTGLFNMPPDFIFFILTI